MAPLSPAALSACLATPCGASPSPTKIDELPVIIPIGAVDGGDPLSAGAIAGIVLAVLSLCLTMWRLYAWVKQRQRSRALAASTVAHTSGPMGQPPAGEKPSAVPPRGVGYPPNPSPPTQSPSNIQHDNVAAHPYGAPHAAGNFSQYTPDGWQRSPGFGPTGYGSSPSDQRMHPDGGNAAYSTQYPQHVPNPPPPLTKFGSIGKSGMVGRAMLSCGFEINSGNFPRNFEIQLTRPPPSFRRNEYGGSGGMGSADDVEVGVEFGPGWNAKSSRAGGCSDVRFPLIFKGFGLMNQKRTLKSL
ncbi:hypothetical protein FB451DRAFT_1375325 [Mycena latifolia]|nr:hypothetical protein FB451DRAFT_1375325 [Mycena latifolia]